MNTPNDILNYIYENKKEMDFMAALMLHKQNFSIAELTDANLEKEGNDFLLKSKQYQINVKIEDDEIQTAIMNQMYVSTFISRFNDSYQIHFLVHKYPKSMKQQFDEQILEEVLRYMILKTVIALRLDSFEKVDEYLCS